MDRRPLLRHHAGGQPQPEAEKVAGQRMQLERTVRLMAVQEDRDRDDGDVGERKRHHHVAPPGEIEQTGVHARKRPEEVGSATILRKPERDWTRSRNCYHTPSRQGSSRFVSTAGAAPGSRRALTLRVGAPQGANTASIDRDRDAHRTAAFAAGAAPTLRRAVSVRVGAPQGANTAQIDRDRDAHRTAAFAAGAAPTWRRAVSVRVGAPQGAHTASIAPDHTPAARPLSRLAPLLHGAGPRRFT